MSSPDFTFNGDADILIDPDRCTRTLLLLLVFNDVKLLGREGETRDEVCAAARIIASFNI